MNDRIDPKPIAAHAMFLAQLDRLHVAAKLRVHAFSSSGDYAAVSSELEALAHAARQLATQALVLETASGFRRP